MSLINEALKKAQRARHPGTPEAPGAAAGEVTRRPAPRSTRSTLLIAVGAVVLVVVSMAVTALWLGRSSRPTAAANAGEKAVAAASQAPAPSLVLPLEEKASPPTPAPATPPAASVAMSGGKSVVHPPASTSVAPSPANSTAAAARALPAPERPPSNPGPQPAEAAEPAASSAPIAIEPSSPPKQDERVHQFLDTLRVTGIRAAGNESKVLMNDRVYRVNDIVERALGVKLTKVSSDHLTFTDQNGATYEKYF